MPSHRPPSISRTGVESPRIAPAGDQALVVEFEPRISREVNERVRSIEAAVIQSNWSEIIAVVPSYRSLLIFYEPAQVTFTEIADKIRVLTNQGQKSVKRTKRWRLPVCYDQPCGMDLELLSSKLGLSPKDITRIHSAEEYMVYMIGFSPGFAYLGDLPAELEVPRKTVPNPEVPPNTIQIGGKQTAVSSMPMPSGWYIVGRTPIKMFDPARNPPFLLEGGDFVSFTQIDGDEFLRISSLIESGTFDPEWTWAATP